MLIFLFTKKKQKKHVSVVRVRVGFFSKILSHIYKEKKKDNDNMKK